MHLECFFQLKGKAHTPRFCGPAGLGRCFRFPKEIPSELKASSMFPTERLSELIRFIQLTSPGEEALCAAQKRILWNPILSPGVATVAKRSINEGIKRYTSTTLLLQDYLTEYGVRGWVAK